MQRPGGVHMGLTREAATSLASTTQTLVSTRPRCLSPICIQSPTHSPRATAAWPAPLGIPPLSSTPSAPRLRDPLCDTPQHV